MAAGHLTRRSRQLSCHDALLVSSPVGDRCIVVFTHTLQGHWDEAGTLAAWRVHLSLFAGILAGLSTWALSETRSQDLHASCGGAIAAGSGKVSE